MLSYLPSIRINVPSLSCSYSGKRFSASNSDRLTAMDSKYLLIEGHSPIKVECLSPDYHVDKGSLPALYGLPQKKWTRRAQLIVG